MFCIRFVIPNSSLDSLDPEDIFDMIRVLLNDHGNTEDVRVSATNIGEHTNLDLLPADQQVLLTKSSYLTGLVAGFLWANHIHQYSTEIF